MAITYEWKITALKKAPSLDGLSDVVTHINFEYKGSDDSTDPATEGVFNGACPVGPADKDNFVALGELKESDVIEWAKANHPVEHMQDVIQKLIDEQLTPKNVEVDALPWVEEAPAEEESEEEESSEE
tara:strand:+ start:159 stop:542 length:384 start_codon:yes stop_codon:yes gene_type:complete